MRQRTFYKPYNEDLVLDAKQTAAMNELINEYGYSLQTEIV